MANALIKAMNQIQHVCRCKYIEETETGQKQEQKNKFQVYVQENFQKASQSQSFHLRFISYLGVTGPAIIYS